MDEGMAVSGSPIKESNTDKAVQIVMEGTGAKKKNFSTKRVYRGLRKFRAGVESGISWLKRSFGLDRCIWKGIDSFRSYVWRQSCLQIC